jgi:ABC-2 type transport system ATP-binding protein
VAGGAEVLAEALARLDGHVTDIVDVGLRRPDLDDVFLTLTGHAAEEAAGEKDAGADAVPVPSAGGAR